MRQNIYAYLKPSSDCILFNRATKTMIKSKCDNAEKLCRLYQFKFIA